MKKIITLLFVLMFVSGCGSKNTPVEKEKEQEVPVKMEEVERYSDNNTTPIGIYRLEGNKLTKLKQISESLIVEKDIGVFQIYPSSEDEVILSSSFGQSFYDEWLKYNNGSLRIGFNVKFTKNDGEKISYNILNPSQTFDHWEQLMNYLYDDYANLGKGFYSHIENDEYNDNTLFTSFKMQSSYQCGDIASKIQLSVFTYDTDDDFGEDGEYRGNSLYTLDICVNGVAC